MTVYSIISKNLLNRAQPVFFHGLCRKNQCAFSMYVKQCLIHYAVFSIFVDTSQRNITLHGTHIGVSCLHLCSLGGLVCCKKSTLFLQGVNSHFFALFALWRNFAPVTKPCKINVRTIFTILTLCAHHVNTYLQKKCALFTQETSFNSLLCLILAAAQHHQ